MTTEHPQSPIAGLLKARERRVRSREVTFGLPETPVFVRYRAASQKEISRLSGPTRAAEKSGSAEKIAAANVKFAKSLLAETCVGIFVKDDATGDLVSADPEGDAPTFDARLCELFDVDVPASATEIVGLLYTDMDALAVHLKLVEFSAGGEIETLEDLPGN